MSENMMYINKDVHELLIRELDMYKRHVDELQLIIGMLSEHFSIAEWRDMIDGREDKDRILYLLEFHDCCPSEVLRKDYRVSITVPVTVSLTVSALNADDAEEIAQSEVEGNGIEHYYMDYNMYYDAEFDVEEVD